MPYPTKQVVEALLESYLNMRKAEWQVTEENIASLDPKSRPAQKVAVCKSFFEKLKNIDDRSTNDWVDIIKELHLEIERQDQEEASTRAMPLGLHVAGLLDNLTFNLLLDKRLLGETLKAAQTYILHELADRSNFKNIVGKAYQNKAAYENELRLMKSQGADKKEIAEKKKQLADVDKEISYLVTKEPLFHETFFANKIAKHDPKAKELSESKFETFATNVSDGKRTFTLRDAILRGPAPKADASASTESESSDKSLDKVDVPERPTDATGTAAVIKANVGRTTPAKKSPSALGAQSFVATTGRGRGAKSPTTYQNPDDYINRRAPR